MKLTSSQEEYLKTIYILENSERKIRVTDIANKLNITKPSVSKAISNLKELKFLSYKAYGEIKLTKQGENIAKEILKKQDILEMFLTEVLEVEERQAKEEAKSMKHAISETTAKKLDNYIGKVLNLGDLNCGYDEKSERCKNCVKIITRNRIKKQKMEELK